MTAPPKVFALDPINTVEMCHHDTSCTDGELRHALPDHTGTDSGTLLVASTTAAVERGCFGSPTFFVGEEMWFGKEHLPDVVRFAREA